MSNFVHLHVHSDYSLLRGAAKIKALVRRAAELEMKAMALTDSGNMFGAVEFVSAASQAGLQPILGMETYITRGSLLDKSPRNRSVDGLLLYAKNEVGFRNLIKISTKGFLEGFYYRPRVDYEFLEDHAEGLIAVTAGVRGAPARELLEGRAPQALALAGRIKEIFDGEFWIGLENHGLPGQRAVLPQLTDLAKRAGVQPVALNDVAYLKAEDAEAHEILMLIREQKSLADANRYRRETDQRFLKSAAEMEELFGALPEALHSTEEIAERVQFNMEFGNLLLPAFPLPEGFASPEDYLEHLAGQGLEARYSTIDEELQARFRFELDIILQMGYAGYFLIVRDFIKQARDIDISVGPGRGSAAGSLIAYCLGITDIDPIRFGLLFERFLNPERVSMPDIDIDFDYRRRGEVIEYVKHKYGEDSVTQIITFGTMAARGVLRDVGRVLGLSYGEVDQTAKLVPPELGITLDKAIEMVPELQEMAKDKGQYGKLLTNARKLEGLSRHASTHAAGVLIAPGRLDDVVPLFRSGKGEVSTQWDMKASEQVGLLKMDFLGLRTLTVIEDCLKLIEERTGSKPDLSKIPLEDEQTFDLLKEASTVGVFQLESAGMRDLLRRLAPESFEDIIAVNALYRPGPMGSGMVTDFIDCKRGDKAIRYEHECLEPILKPTYGMMVYQEQVMQIASVMAGFSLGDADLLRRAMGKKKPEEMAAQRERFLKGAQERGHRSDIAARVFEQMEYFAGYGFNKSHSAAYALISYHTAYLKANFPADFLAASMTSEMDSTARVMILVEECRRLGIPVQGPDVNSSHTVFTVTGDQQIRFGMGAIKNVGTAVIDELVKERVNGPYLSIFDLCRRVGHQILNKRVLESLVAAGAMDSIHSVRASAYGAVAGALESGSRHQVDADRGQTSLFDSGDIPLDPELPGVEEWERSERLRFEKEVLGFYLSDHPLSAYRDEIAALATGSSEVLRGINDGVDVSFLGVISGVLKKIDKKGRTMGFVQVEDFSGSLECVLFARIYEEAAPLLDEDRIALFRGRLDRREEDSDPKLIVDEVTDLESNRSNLEHRLLIQLPLQGFDENSMEELKTLLSQYPGRGNVVLHLELETGRHVEVKVGSHKVSVDPQFMAALRARYGADAVRLGRVDRPSKPKPTRGKPQWQTGARSNGH